jgi:hypothetical protein
MYNSTIKSGLSALSLCVLSLLGAQDSLVIKYAETITAAELSTHLNIIAADDYEGRETGYKGQRMCEEYMVNFYKSLGLPPVKGSYTQEFKVSLDDPSKVLVKAGEKVFSFLDDYYYFPGTKDRKMSGKVLFSGYGIDDQKFSDIDKDAVEGKVVIVWDGEPRGKDGKYLIGGEEPSTWSATRDAKQRLMENNGAVALMVVYADYEARIEQVRGYFSHKGMSLPQEGENEPATMPVFHISTDMARDIMGSKNFKKLTKAKLKRKKMVLESKQVDIAFARSSEMLTSSNVMGYIEGTDKKEEVIVITAHYDHIGVDGDVVYNGADDDGSGTVATLEIAQAFAQAKAEGNGPRRSIMILNVSGEEKGLLGSQYYTEHPVLPLENTVADLNIDMIGRVDEQHEGNENYVYLIGADRLSQGLHDAGEKVNKAYVGLELDYTFNAEDDPNRFYYRSDHYNFAKNNVPSVFYFSGVHEDYHQPGDTVDKIMFPKLAKITKLIFYTAWELANSEERIRVD